jgi:hypothetical protein
MEEIAGKDAPSPTSWRQFRRFLPYLLAISLGAVSHDVAAATYWRVQQSGITTFVEGDKDTAKRVAETTLRLQSAARWLFNWPESHREPPVLIFVVEESLLRRTFQYPAESNTAYTDYAAGHESWARTPSLIVVAASMGHQKGEELRSLQHAYGEALLRAEPSHDWPPCVHVGMSLLLAAAELTPPNRFYVSGEKLRGPFIMPQDIWNPARDIWNPERFLVPTNARQERMPQWELDQGAYSCLRLSFMIASAIPEQRTALERMLTAVGRGMPLGEATRSELQQTLPEFTARYHEFNPYQDIRLDLPDEIPVTPEPVPITPEEVHVLMGKLCSRLNNCRK